MRVSARLIDQAPGVAILTSIPPAASWTDILTALETLSDLDAIPELQGLAAALTSYSVDSYEDALALQYDPNRMDFEMVRDAVLLLEGTVQEGDVCLRDETLRLLNGDKSGLSEVAPAVEDLIGLLL